MSGSGIMGPRNLIWTLGLCPVLGTSGRSLADALSAVQSLKRPIKSRYCFERSYLIPPESHLKTAFGVKADIS